MRRRWLKSKLRNRVVVYTLDDKTLSGVLSVSAPDGVVLINAIAHDSQDVPLPGEVFVDRANVRYIQVVPAP